MLTEVNPAMTDIGFPYPALPLIEIDLRQGISNFFGTQQFKNTFPWGRLKQARDRPKTFRRVRLLYHCLEFSSPNLSIPNPILGIVVLCPFEPSLQSIHDGLCPFGN